MAEPVHNSVTTMATGKPLLLLAHGDQETRQLAVMQGQSGVIIMLVQALSTPREGAGGGGGVLNESQNNINQTRLDETPSG